MSKIAKEQKEKIGKALADAGMGDILLQQLLDSITQKGCDESCGTGCSKCCSSGTANRVSD